MKAQTTSLPPAWANWKKIVARYQSPDVRISVWQVINSVVPYLLLWAAAYLSLQVSYWLTLALSVVAAGFLVRLFIIFHDCGHGSFFKSRRANDIVGSIMGVFVFAPYFMWRHEHAIHHASSGDLDRRGVGDVWMLTVDEYVNGNRWQRVGYRIYRFPLILFFLAPIFLFLISFRFAFFRKGKKREKQSVWLTNVGLLAIFTAASLTIGWQAYLAIQLPIISVAAIVGVWLFFIQHQYEGVYWEHHENWNYVEAALKGSSFYRLPRVLQWFTGNIGFHHIHHLSPRIPNYYLERCYEENEMFQIDPVTIRLSFKAARLHLWDEGSRQLIKFKELKDALNRKTATTSI